MYFKYCTAYRHTIYLKTSKLYYIYYIKDIYELNAWTRDHVNNFWDTSTPICQSRYLAGIYTGPNAGQVNS